MASILNVPDCASVDTVFNTGRPLCDFIKGIPKKGVILLDRGATFDTDALASVTAFLAELQTKTTAARGDRAYPIWDIDNFEEEVPDPTTGAVGNMTTEQIFVSDPLPAFRVGYGGGELQHARIGAMSGGSYDFMIVDDNYTVYGTRTADGGMKGWSTSQIFVYPSKFRVADAVNQYSFRIQLSSIAEYRENIAAVKANSTILEAYGLISVPLSELSNASNVYKIQAIADGGTNLEPIYGADISALTWTAEYADGSAFTVTSVADDAALDAYTVTLDSTAYTALASGATVTIKGPTAAALAAAGVAPYEFIDVIVTKA
jgi:hypothetical protein